MKIAILSSFPLFDKQPHKIFFLNEVIKKKFIDDVIIIYSHTAFYDYAKELSKRIKDISLKSNNKNINIREISFNETLKDFAKKNSIKTYFFRRFSDNGCIKLLREYKSDIIHNFSGEYVPKALLNISELGILSAHYGKLPEIRGGDSIRWSIYLNFPLYVSHFFLDSILDMGDIALLSKVSVNKDDSLSNIRKKCQTKAFEGHLKVLDMIYDNKLVKIMQKPEEGSTYYRMGKYLIDKVDLILKNREYGHYDK